MASRPTHYYNQYFEALRAEVTSFGVSARKEKEVPAYAGVNFYFLLAPERIEKEIEINSEFITSIG